MTDRFIVDDAGTLIDMQTRDTYDYISDVCGLLNELHSRNKRLEESIQRERTSFTKTHERWSKEAETKIKELSEENEQLKCGNKNLKAILNDFINICNRLQSNPNDKQTLNVARDMLQNMGCDLE